ncbi:MAG: hypothetical protein A2Y10_19965 [Planctomycetes bacterium GWF2_41_51]|nr:MAG: hypothetical protein A2Y10_19965 [Planctomycetes bacterium GWF2_41_51]HBG28562.1 hypothetical protein [Phycisphaerales bacterium]
MNTEVTNKVKAAKTVTMEHVAKELNVSVSTVSRAFSRSYLVTSTTRERIKKYCEKLNYRPNLNARAIAMKKSQNIGFVARDISFMKNFESFAVNLEECLKQKGYRLQIELGHSDPIQENAIVESMLDRLIDGIIICSRHYIGTIEAVETLKNTSVPFVVLGYYHDQLVNQVAEDILSGAKILLKHLIGLKHSRIALITYQEGDPRISAFKQTYQEEGLSFDEGLIFHVSHDMRNLDKVINEILDKKVTALLAINDQMTAIIYRICHRMKIKIPDDLAIASISTCNETDIWNPPLTTYNVYHENYANLIGTILLDKIANPNGPNRIVHFGGELIIRESTLGLLRNIP